MPAQHVWAAAGTFPWQTPSSSLHRSSRGPHRPSSVRTATRHHRASGRATCSSASRDATWPPPVRRTSRRTLMARWGHCRKCPPPNASMTSTQVLVTHCCMCVACYFHHFLCLCVAILSTVYFHVNMHIKRS